MRMQSEASTTSPRLVSASGSTRCSGASWSSGREPTFPLGGVWGRCCLAFLKRREPLCLQSLLYCGNQAAGWHPCPHSSGLVVEGQACPSGHLDLHLVPYSLWECLVGEAALLTFLSSCPPRPYPTVTRTLK